VHGGVDLDPEAVLRVSFLRVLRVLRVKFRQERERRQESPRKTKNGGWNADAADWADAGAAREASTTT